MELLGSEETEVRLEESTMTNYGPGNLPAFQGFADDSFEASECNNGETAPVTSIIEQRCLFQQQQRNPSWL